MHSAIKIKIEKHFKRNIFYCTLFLFISLLIGVLGYHFFANITWIDSLHNASMILSGMGPVVEIKNEIGKLFSSFYAIFSGIAFITNIGLLLTPMAHYIFHKLQVEE